jgi:hypothetical protein
LDGNCFVFGTWWQERKQQAGERAVPSPEVLKKRRSQLIDVVRFNVEGLLNQTLYRVGRIDLALEDRPDAVINLVNLMVQEPGGERLPLRPGRTITSVFDAHAHSLLILGAPGSGKTTLLLELARDLLNRADPNTTDPIPVVFFLASWIPKFASLHDWLTVELNRVYNVPRAIAAELVESGQILPLLDALDEAVTGNRDACLKSLNEFRHSDGLTPFAVSSRIEDYERLSGALELSGAIMIQPLAETEIRSYLIDTDAPSGLLDGFDRDPDLRELLNTPLWMNVVLHAFRDSPDALLLGNLASADLRRLILSGMSITCFRGQGRPMNCLDWIPPIRIVTQEESELTRAHKLSTGYAGSLRR